MQWSYENNWKKRVILTVDFMLNGISKKGFSKNHKVKMINFPGGNSKNITDQLDVFTKKCLPT